MVPAVFGSGVL